MIYWKNRNIEKTIEFAEKSLQLALEVGDPIAEKTVRVGIALAQAEKGDFTQAVEHLERCVEIDRQLNHPHLEQDMQQLLFMQLRAFSANGKRYELLENVLAQLSDLQKAQLFQEIDDWPRATRFYQSFLQANKDSLAATEQAQVQNMIAIGFIKQSKGDSAVSALQAFEQAGEREMVGTVYNNLGSAHKLREDWPEALAWLRKSAAHNRAVAGDSASVLGFTYFHLAVVFHRTGAADSARFYIEKSLALRHALGETASLEESESLREKILGRKEEE